MPSGDDFYAACHAGVEGTRLVAMGTAGVVFYSDNGGANWTAGNGAAIAKDVRGVSRGHAADAVVVAVGDSGGCYRSTDAGATWGVVVSATAADLYAVTRCQGAMVAVGFDGQVVRSTNSGSTWASIIGPVNAGEHLYGVSAWLLTVVAVGAGGIIRISEDGGLSWKPVPSPTTMTLRAVHRSPSGRWTAAGFGGTIIQSLDEGKTWVLRQVLSFTDLWAVGSDWPVGRAVAAGEDGNIFVE
ncbi:hypothetical protein OV079_00040 [Nannocystis pusilla]|nr:hypothetical protein [Nannocystis pusilla]MCY1003981.1 hypothetical protein [Nannocystis pusilla]